MIERWTSFNNGLKPQKGFILFGAAKLILIMEPTLISLTAYMSLDHMK